jgi:hypothetical protein
VRPLLRERTRTLQDVVGQRVGDQIDAEDKAALAVEHLSRRQAADVLVHLKRRIRGDFYVIEQDDEKIVPGNRACPFADKVLGRTALRMMTSNVFGVAAADNLGYAKVVLEKAIARGQAGCRVVVYLKPAAEAARGRE